MDALLALALAVVPLLVPLPVLAYSLLAQTAAAFLLLRSLGWLYARGGLLSFGQAMYAGLGGYAAAHAMNAIAAHGWAVSFALVPLYAAGFAAGIGLILGPVSVRRGGLSFAMITLGLGVLAAQLATMLQGFFGGEGGVWTDRSAGPAWLGLDFDSLRQVYALSAAYALLAALALRRLDLSRWGLTLLAVRDNPLRCAVSGLSPRRQRLQAVLVAAALAGLAGGLQTLHLEQISASSLGLAASSLALLFSLAGGAGSGWGALLGAVLMVAGTQGLVQWTQGWMLDMALVFLAVVVWAPRGLAPLLGSARRSAADRPDRFWGHAAFACTAALAAVAVAGAVQSVYAWRQQLGAVGGVTRSALSGPDVWAGLLLAALTGAGLAVLVAWQLRTQESHT